MKILTYEDGRPIEGAPEPLPPGASIEGRIAWMRARAAYADRVTDVANRAFDARFRVALALALALTLTLTACTTSTCPPRGGIIVNGDTTNDAGLRLLP